jgi:hypothetical protein
MQWSREHEEIQDWGVKWWWIISNKRKLKEQKSCFLKKTFENITDDTLDNIQNKIISQIKKYLSYLNLK